MLRIKVKSNQEDNSSHNRSLQSQKHSSSFKLSAFLMVDFKELAHVTVEKLICSHLRHLIASNMLILWGVEILLSGNKETLATDLQKPCFQAGLFMPKNFRVNQIDKISILILDQADIAAKSQCLEAFFISSYRKNPPQGALR